MIVDKLHTPKHNCIHHMQYGMVDSNSDRDHDLLIAIVVCTVVIINDYENLKVSHT